MALGQKMFRSVLFGAKILYSAMVLFALIFHIRTFWNWGDPGSMHYWRVVLGLSTIGISAPSCIIISLSSRRRGLELIGNAPLQMRIALGGLLLYALITFLYIRGVVLEWGGPSQENGQFALTNKGTIIRVLSEPEFIRLVRAEYRAESALYLFFTWGLLTSIVGAGYYCAKRKQREPTFH